VTTLITGANGFVGRALIAALARKGIPVRGAVRGWEGIETGSASQTWCAVGDVGPRTDWSRALRDVDAVVHLVARTHIRDHGNQALPSYRQINVEGTRRLAEQAASAGVRRLVFVSSIKVLGERTLVQPFRAGDEPAPQDAYGISKREAEQALMAVAAGAGMETVIVRPPVIYGPGVKGNFLRLMRLIAKGTPLPFDAVKNRRSIVAVENLADLLMRCLEASEARGRILLVSDGESLSTPQLIRLIAAAMGRPARLVPVPPWALRGVGWFAGRSDEMARLCGSLEVDDSETQELLAWQPPVSTDRAIRDTVEHFMSAQARQPAWAI